MSLITVLTSVSVLSLVRVRAVGGTECNSSVEMSPGETLRLLSPPVSEENQGARFVCWYRIQQKDNPLSAPGVFRIAVSRFSIGSLESSGCVGGYLQIHDSPSPAVNSQLGFHCGEVEQPQLVVRESESIRLTFFTDTYSRDVEWDFTVQVVSKAEVPERYGSHPAMFPGKVGALVEETYCETVFQDCRGQQCNVQSPGYPGVYPRGVSCRYYISTKSSLIKLYVDKPYWEAFNVDGRSCENGLLCEVRELRTDGVCPRDYIKLYDGVDEFSPLIGQFCGIGSFPVSIIGSSDKLFLEFVTSQHGPLLNTGFDFRVTSIPQVSGVRQDNGSCHQTVDSRSLQGSEGISVSLEHWYPPATNCSLLLTGTDTQIVRLNFQKMTKNAVRTPILESRDQCGEILTLYDSHWPDPQRIIKTFCSRFSQVKENIDFITSGPNMYVSFFSPTGSYSSSFLYYWATYDFHETATDGDPVPGSLCDQTFSPHNNPKRTFRSPRNTLIFKNAPKDVVCEYKIAAKEREFSRISLSILKLDFNKNGVKCKICWNNNKLDRIEVQDPRSSINITDSCFSFCTKSQPKVIYSLGPELSLRLKIGQMSDAQEQLRLSYYKKKDPIFRAEYKFLHPAVCGQTEIPGEERGSVTFPVLRQPGAVKFQDVECLWDLKLTANRPISIEVTGVVYRLLLIL